MKKFLSLLLALTLVLSLVVVPARADVVTPAAATGTTISASTLTLEKGANAGNTLTVTTTNAKVGNATCTVATSGTPYTWQSSNTSVATISGNNSTGTITAVAEGTTTITCKVAYTYTDTTDNSTKNAEETVSCTVNVTDRDKGIASISFGGRSYAVTSNAATVYYTASELANATWNVAAKANYTASIDSSFNKPTEAPSSTVAVPVKVTSAGSSEDKTVTVTVTMTALTAPTVSASPANVVNGQTLTYTASGNVNASSSYVGYDWSVTLDGNPVSVTVIEQKNNTWKIKAPAANASSKHYVVNCVAKEGSASSVAGTTDLTVTQDKYTPAYNKTTSDSSKILVYGSSNQKEWTKIPDPYLKGNGVADVTSGYTLAYKSSNTSVASVDSNGKVTASSTAGQATITVTITYQGKDYELLYTIYNRAPSYTIPTSIQAGAATPYDTATLRLYASHALASAGITGSAASITGISYVAAKSNCTVTQPSYGSTTYYVTGGTFGTATFTGTVSTYSNGTYPITFTVAVKPQATTYEDQYPEPVAYGNTYRYYVQVPSGYSSYYVLGTPNQTTEPNWTLTGTQYYGSTLYYLTDANFVGGKCTLWLVTKDSYGRYYCGQLTVYQKNYNINYNGVAGETVQFKHADFTNFMNEVSQARGDASKTGSYPYVTFNYVTFNYPTSTQGTLYYNGTAMSNSSYSGSFNSRTQITNLDNVTFVPYARTSAKSIPLTFTLSVTKYGANGAVVNRDLKYTGTVVVSIVREDIKYTAAPGDTIRFTDSDFLNYLRTQNGFNSNYYSIDYVTFDQSAVNALNEGVLYAYSTGFNAVKTTDKFYYTTTSYNQNALSDVTFRASAYAKTGTTVYIPFTIYARYGTTGTGTRQVSGTVAIKLAQTMNFVDVKPTDYFYDSVKWAVNSNITKGTSATTFSPYKTCTRAEIVTFLWRAAGSKTPTITRNPFTDVAPSMGMDYYYAILWASQNGIAAGTSATTFSPNATCTRAQIVTFLWRYSNKPAGYYSNPFTDVNKAEHAAYYDAILWAVGKGITKGTTATTFSPYGTCTRGEAVTFLYRAVNGK